MATAAMRSTMATLAANARWAKTADRAGAMSPAREGFRRRFEHEVDPDGKLPPHERAALAENALKAHMARLRLKRQQKKARKA